MYNCLLCIDFLNDLVVLLFDSAILWLKYINRNFVAAMARQLRSIPFIGCRYRLGILSFSLSLSPHGFLSGLLFVRIPSKLSYLPKRSMMSHTRDNTIRSRIRSLKLRFREGIQEIRPPLHWKLPHIFIASRNMHFNFPPCLLSLSFLGLAVIK